MSEIAWLDCSYGRISDPFPGQCELYTDTNSDQICDRSQPLPASSGSGQAGGVGDMRDFLFGAIFLILAIYFIHWYLVNKTKLSENFKFLSRAHFRYSWNLVLLLSFLPAAISGLLWVLGVTNFDFNLWHSRAGIVFSIVAALHLLGRWGYFVKRF